MGTTALRLAACSGKKGTSSMKFFVLSSSLLAAALAEPHGLGLGVAVHPGLATSYVGPTVWGHPHVGKRSAEPGVALHPGLATSYVGPTTYGLPHGYPAPHFIGKRSAEPHGTGVALHPGHDTSYVGPTTFGLPHHFLGKRSAEPQGTGVALGLNTIPTIPIPTSTGGGGGYGKRSADADAHGVLYGLPYVGPAHPFINLYGKRSADADADATADADAEADPHYGYYGYGLGYGYPYAYGYGLPYWYGK